MLPLVRDGQPSTRRLLVWFVLTAIVPAGALAWLAWTLVRQDRAREVDSRRNAREQAVELAATALQRTLAQLEEQLSTFSLGQPLQPGSIALDVALATFSRDELRARAGLSLPFYPIVEQAEPSRTEILARADRLEFETRDHSGALRLLNPLTTVADLTTRGEALVRIGRLQRKQGDASSAIDAFERLGAIDRAIVSGAPAGLIGAQGRALVLAAEHRRSDLEQTAADLLRHLESGRWALSRSQYEFARRQTHEWLRRVEPPAANEHAALASAAESAWNEWRTAADRVPLSRSRTTVWTHDRSVLVLTRSTPETLTVLLAGPGFLAKYWHDTRAADDVRNVDLALTDADGRAVVGDARVPLDRQSVRTASVTNLPWTVHAIAREAMPVTSLSRQAVLMLSGIVVMMIVVGTGGYVITRALARELRVARLQSDFVAAVSHEFRSPLTTVRQLAELLAGGRVSTEARRTEFYGILMRESERLHRLVESLLNFARLEAGELEYRFENVSPGVFVRDLVNDVQDEIRDRARIELVDGDPHLPAIRADRELLSLVFWNLLDNAVKYSPDERDVRVELDRADDRLILRVRDRGMGIPAAERQEIFRKFVRGAAAKTASIKGTGIGLAMAREIVHAHGGEISVESEVGVGSTFTVMLPFSPALGQ